MAIWTRQRQCSLGLLRLRHFAIRGKTRKITKATNLASATSVGFQAHDGTTHNLGPDNRDGVLMDEWRHLANTNRHLVGCYEAAAKELGIRMMIGPPSSHGAREMRGVYTEPLSHEKKSELMVAYNQHESAYNNNPFKPERG